MKRKLSYLFRAAQKKKQSIEELKDRVKSACDANTDYRRELKNFYKQNCNNLVLISNIQSYKKFLIDCGATEQQAAKDTLVLCNNKYIK